MKQILVACCLALLCGCATVMNRVTGDNVTTEPYLCTEEAVAGCTCIAFPQVLNPEPFELYCANILTFPVGLCCFVIDVPFELVSDTLFYPFDAHYTKKRREEFKSKYNSK